MNLILIRDKINEFGCFGHIVDEKFNLITASSFQTLEHSYPIVSANSFSVKIPDGIYRCVRGMHRLESMTSDFETFEVTNVPGHSKILLHQGNVNADSDGCILLGMERLEKMITKSHIAFVNFMALQKDVNDFSLMIKTIYT